MAAKARRHEEEDRDARPVVLVGRRAVERWTASRRPGGPAARAEALGRISSFAFSCAVHLLAFLLLLEIVWLAAPAADERVLTASLRRPGEEGPPAPRPEPASAPEPADEPAEPASSAPAPAPAVIPVSAPAAAPAAGPARPEPAAAEVVDGIFSYPAGDLPAAGMGHAGDRSAAGRKAAIERYGGNLASESAVELGLEWLLAHQGEDGRWCPSSYLRGCPEPDVCGRGRGPSSFAHGTTGLALLAFLGAGYTHREGKHREAVKRGLEWLRGRQHASGFFFDPADPRSAKGGMYGHGIAMFALGEAALLTGDDALRPALERGAAATARAQHRNGGWYYTPGSSAPTSELTLSVWQMMGLHAAEKAGAILPTGVLDRARRHLVDNHAAGGGFPYLPGGAPTEGATGAGLFARCLLGLAGGGRIEEGWGWLEAQSKSRPDPSRVAGWQYLYSWYYRTLVAHQLQGTAWRDWNRTIRPFLVSTQRTRGHAAGSWPFIDYEQASTIYSTALCVLMLETYYRYAPAAAGPAALVAGLAEGAGGAPLSAEEERRMDAVVPPSADALRARERRDREEARRRLSSDAPEDRYLGARRLAELGDRESLPSMIAAAKREAGRLRAAHLLFIGRLKDEKAVDFLMQELEDTDPDVRAAAATALGAATGVYLTETSRWKEWHRAWKSAR